MNDSPSSSVPSWLIVAGVASFACFIGVFVLGLAAVALYLFGVSAPVSAPVGGPISPPQPVPAGQIVFSTGRDGNFEIYTINSDGTSLTRLTDDPADDLHPEWSPDGTRIAFNSNRTGDHGIYVMDADGSNVVRIMAEGEVPAWSPDGSQITYSDQYGIHVMDADGSHEVQLTNHDDSAPNWSPDGLRIAFSRRSNDGTSSDIFLMDPDSTNLTQLTDAPGNSYNPVWSPDGTQIAFISDRDGTPQLFVMNADGTGEVQLTITDGIAVSSPSWSFDGLYIVVQFSSADGWGDLFVVPVGDGALTGSDALMLNSDPADDRDPDWSPIP
jgi:Tol biopolymer transport system component